jgi:hypothetical protein
MGHLKQFQTADALPEGFNVFDSLIWRFALWLNQQRLITLEKKGVQLRGGFSNGRD